MKKAPKKRKRKRPAKSKAYWSRVRRVRGHAERALKIIVKAPASERSPLYSDLTRAVLRGIANIDFPESKW